MKFINEPERDLLSPEHNKNLMKAFELVDSQKGQNYPLIVGGEKITTDEKIESYNPGNKSELIGSVCAASVELAEAAMVAAQKAFESWRKTTIAERISYMDKLKEKLNEKRYEMTVWMVEESGKNWGEAEGEICETIDFINAYSLGMLEIEKGLELVPSDEEDRKSVYIPIGVGIMIPPWNFPLALLAGMVTSAVLAGNTVVMKPSSDTPVVAYKFMELIEEAGFPNGVVNFISGRGGEVGDYLVKHPKTRFINFTGSKNVGVRINQFAAVTGEEQIWLKRVVAEMGGKNSIIVDSSADIESAADGIVNSAFSFQGQKCSACSRAIVLSDVYDQIVDSVAKKAGKLEAGTGRENYFSGPVVSKRAYDGIVEYIEIGKKEGTLVAGGTYSDELGFFIAPTVFSDIASDAKISKEEIFGPVLAIIKAETFEQAVEIANNTEYGLTGGVYSSDTKNLQKAEEDFTVGNLYFNRKCTGAVVMQNPFGGMNMSGTDAKTGTKDYLHNFLQLKSITAKKL